MKSSKDTTSGRCCGLSTAASQHAWRCIVALLLLTSSLAMPGQQPAVSSAEQAGSNWQRVKALPVNTGLHVTTDHGGKSCRIFAVSDDALICAKGGKAGLVLQRREIRHIKLTHYVRSALVGAGVGAGIGGAAGGIGGRSTPCPAGGGFCLNNIGLGPGAVALVFGVGAGVVGSVVGGVTDLARGSSIYTRP